MVCIYCGSVTQVINSRPQKRLNQVWRRRECKACRGMFTSHEAPDLSTGIVVQYADEVQPFVRDQLFLSVYESLRHRLSALADATELTKTIIGKLLSQHPGPALPREHIIATTLETLKNFDQAALVHYKAFHPYK